MSLTPEQLDEMRYAQAEWKRYPAPCGISHDDEYNPCMPQRGAGDYLWCMMCGAGRLGKMVMHDRFISNLEADNGHEFLIMIDEVASGKSFRLIDDRGPGICLPVACVIPAADWEELKDAASQA